MCGFSPTLLRAWESRHALLEPVRQPSGHRLYTDDDVRVLRRVAYFLEQGQSIGEIAALGRETLQSAGERVFGGSVGEARMRLETGSSNFGPLEVLKREIVDAALGLDESRIRLAFDRLESLLPRRELIHGLVTSVAREMGTLWLTGGATVASEHLLSGLLAERVRRWTTIDVAASDGKGIVLCATFPDEQHDLGLLVLIYELRSVGREAVCLGPGLPFVDLERAIFTTRSKSVCLSVTRQVTCDVHLARFREMVEHHPAVNFVLGGGGIVHREADLVEMGVIAWPSHRCLMEIGEVVV